MLIDVHILTLPDMRRDWWAACQASLVDHPIRVHMLDGIAGNISAARAKGFALGDSPYVSFVDPDDVVLPGGFQACLDALERHPEACGVYTDETVINAEGRPLAAGIWSGRPWDPLLMLEPQYMHHILVMRREYVLPYLDELVARWPMMPEFVLKGLLCHHGPWVNTSYMGYQWRQPPRGSRPTHKTMSQTHICAARWRILPALYQGAVAQHGVAAIGEDHKLRDLSNVLWEYARQEEAHRTGPEGSQLRVPALS